MAIKKQEFYEGAALHLLVRSGSAINIQYRAPFFLLNNKLLTLLKYSANGRSPWGFTFMPEEQTLLQQTERNSTVTIGLICGSDGVVTLKTEDYFKIALARPSAVHIACYRRHGHHYGVRGPDGRLNRKIPPSDWRGLVRD